MKDGCGKYARGRAGGKKKKTWSRERAAFLKFTMKKKKKKRKKTPRLSFYSSPLILEAVAGGGAHARAPECAPAAQ
jgi:hypothetical protein